MLLRFGAITEDATRTHSKRTSERLGHRAMIARPEMVASTKIGYACVSTYDQTRPLETLKRAGCIVIRREKVSGTSLRGRTELASNTEFIGR